MSRLIIATILASVVLSLPAALHKKTVTDLIGFSPRTLRHLCGSALRMMLPGFTAEPQSIRRVRGEVGQVVATTFRAKPLQAQDNFTLTETVHDYDPKKDVTTVRMMPETLSGPKGRYHSLNFTVSYSYPGRTPAPAKVLALELVSVVKARTLNPDLYVVFVVDGEEIHFSSNRSAIRNPVHGKPWVGERMVFQIAREDYIKLASAKKLGVKLGSVSFDFAESHLRSMRTVIDPASTPSEPPQTSPRQL